MMTDKEIIEAKRHFKYGISHDIFKDPVLAYAKTVLWAFDELFRQKAEIERLQKAIKVQDIMIEQQDYKLKAAKSEAIKEFAERLKERVKSAWAKHFCVFPPPQNFDISQKYLKLEDFDKHINNLVKEMVGE